jgi:hypothetical protein
MEMTAETPQNPRGGAGRSPAAHRPGALPRAAAALAALLAAVLLLSAYAAPADAAGRLSTCNEVSGLVPRGDDLTTVDVLRSKGLGCADARRVVARCIAGRAGRGWVASSPETVTVLTNGRRRVTFNVLAGPQPACLKSGQPKGVGAGLQLARNTGEFGPFEGPYVYPDKWPSTASTAYEWGASPVGTAKASIAIGSVSTVTLSGVARNPDGKVRSAWFEWGRTREFRNETADQELDRRGDGGPVEFTARLTHLRAATRYYWRAVVNVETAGGVKRHNGATGSFVTNGYPKVADASRPCDSAPKGQQSDLFELTESLAIACSQPQHFEKGACFPACSDFYNGQLKCTKEFPRNLNAGSWSFTVPKIDYLMTVDNLVSYWRSNDSNRFLEGVPGKNKNSAGGEVGPTPGWHNWDVAQWAYPFTPTSTDARFWINCTEQWGTVIDGDSLAGGEGGQKASTAPPGVPTGLKVTQRDGGLDVDWKAPQDDSPSGIAGYHMTLAAWRQGEARVFPASATTAVNATDSDGRISPALLSFWSNYVKRGLSSSYDMYVAVAAVSREGTVGTPVTTVWPAR